MKIRKNNWGEIVYTWENNFHPDNKDFQQKVIWTAVDKPDGRSMLYYRLQHNDKPKKFYHFN